MPAASAAHEFGDLDRPHPPDIPAAAAIADELGVSFYGPDSPAAQLLHYLRDKHLVIVLDNLEHLLAGIDVVTEIITEAPGATLVTTSRERLNLQGEWVMELGGLVMAHAHVPDEHATSEAMMLFVERAQQVDRTFRLTADNHQVVQRICHAVEGMSLGIELAAAWVRVLSCTEIMQELERSLDVLVYF